MSYRPDRPQHDATPASAAYPPGSVEPAEAGPSGPRAGFGRRLLAFLIDGILISLVSGVVAEAMGYDVFQTRSAPGGGSSYGMFFGGGAFLVRALIEGAYAALMEGRRAGQTIGKAIMRIRVMQLRTGEPLGFGRAAGRYLAKYLSALPLFLGFLWAAWDREKQTWHDKIVGSVVVPTSAYPVDRPIGQP
jgi:uncharacterized RDD family membrane protein YckC